MKKHLPLLLLLICASIFGGTLYLLIRERYESGDVYPPSSSLRSDPLGTMILFESLRALPGVQVERDLSAVNRLPNGQQTTYLHLAADSPDWDEMPADQYRIIERFLLEGGRLVVALTPEYGEKQAAPKADDKKKPSGKKPKEPKEKPDSPDTINLEKKWGLKLSREPGTASENIARNVSALPLPKSLEWHGDLALKDPDASWQILYKNDRGPVLAEKKRGAGSIVVVTDSYIFSNEAMVHDRQPQLLAWLVGSANHIVFDEAHLGIMESPGIATLAEKYRLHGAVAVLVLLAALFIWKNSSSLAPPRSAKKKSSDVIAGRSAGAGFVSLLKRNIPPDHLLDACLDEWKKTFGHGTRFTPREKAAIEAIAQEEKTRPARERDPIAACRRICTVLQRHP